jgi:hypothetical protein
MTQYVMLQHLAFKADMEKTMQFVTIESLCEQQVKLCGNAILKEYSTMKEYAPDFAEIKRELQKLYKNYHFPSLL